MKWCTYSHWHKNYPRFIGKLLKEEYGTCLIKYSEKQIYPPELWDINYVRIFDRLEDTILFMLENNNEITLTSIKEDLLISFYEDAKNIDWKIFMKNKNLMK